MMKDRLEELLASDGGVTNEAFTEDGDSEFRGSFSGICKHFEVICFPVISFCMNFVRKLQAFLDDELAL